MSAPGALVAIGGAEDREGRCSILREYVRLAGGGRARLAVFTIASEQEGVGAAYAKTFKRLGAARVKVVDFVDREEVRARPTLELVARSTGVFFTGGNQLALVTLLGGTSLDRFLHERLASGLVIGGTSAGAAMMADSMIIDGLSGINPRKGAVTLSPGMELLLGAVIDTHFSERGRHGRLLTAMAQCPHDLGLGIDEDTAAVVRRGGLQVFGRGAVTVVDVGAATYDSMSQLSPDDSLALFNVKVHVLPRGHRFNLDARQPEGTRR